jgi:hypothetical protein
MPRAIWSSGGRIGPVIVRPEGPIKVPTRPVVIPATPSSLSQEIDRLGRLPAVVTGSTNMASPTTTEVATHSVAYRITEQRRRLVSEVVEQAFLRDIAAMGVWPGQVIQGKALLSGDVAPIGPVQRIPGTLNVSTEFITGTPSTQSAPVAAPTAASVDQARRAIIKSVNPTDAAGLLKTNFEKATTFREVGVKVGLSVSGQAFGVDANMSLNQTYKQSTAVAVIRQVFYSASFLPSGPQAKGFWPDSVRYADVSPFMGAGNPPLYIESVQYGRLICITAQGAFASSNLIAALKASYDASIKASSSVDYSAKKILESSKVEIYTLGVPGYANFQTLSDPLNELSRVFKSGLSFSANNPGAPISFTARHIADGTLARVGLSAEYVAPISAVGVDVWNRTFQVWDGAGGGQVDTNISVNPGDTVTVSTSGQIWSGVVFSGTHGPEGWPGHTADAAAPLRSGTAYSFIISFGGEPGSWIEAMGFWQGSPAAGKGGRLLLNINDNNTYNGDKNKKWTSVVSVKRGDAAAAGIYI